MKMEYSACITIYVGFTAPNEYVAAERGQKIADACKLVFTSPSGKPRTPPVWVGDTEVPEVEIAEA